jgi:hypothetical protein
MAHSGQYLRRWGGRLLPLLAVLLLAGCQPREVLIVAETPVFATPSADAAVVTVAMADTTLPIQAVQRVYLQENPALRHQRTWHPLMVYTDFYQVSLRSGVTGWVSEDLLVDRATGTVVPRPLPQPIWQYLFLLGLAGLVVLGLAWWRQGGWQQLAGPTPRRATWLALGWLCLLRATLLALVLYLAGRVMIHPTDETGYFAIARNLLDGQLGERWTYTIGQGLLYLPLVLVTGARDYYGIVAPLSLLTAFVLAPLALVLLHAILGELGATARQRLLVLALLVVLPFLYVPVEQHPGASAVREVFKAIFMVQDLSPASYSLYHLYFWTGLNGLSDTPGMVLVLLCVWLALRLAPGRRYLIAIAALFGFACLVRINYVFFAPLLAYLFWERLRPLYRSPRQALGLVGLAVAVFLAVFGWQLVANRLHHGGWLTFPYVLHQNRAAEGFALALFKSGGRYLVQCNFLYMVLAAAGVWFVRESRQRIVLLLWAVPLLLFFAGYPVVAASPIRFILPIYGALLALAVLARPWEGLPTSRAIALTLVLIANVVLVAPNVLPAPPYALRLEQWPNGAQLVRQLALYLPLASLALTVVLCRQYRRPLRFMIVALGLWYAASGLLVLAVLGAALAWALRDAVVAVREWWLAQRPAPPAA